MTIGPLKSEKVVCDILAAMGDRALTRRATRLLTQTKFRLRQLRHIPDQETREYCLQLLRREAEERVRYVAGDVGPYICNPLASNMFDALRTYFRTELGGSHDQD